MDVGSQENTIDTVLMLWNSPGLAISAGVYWLTVLGTNMFGVLVTLHAIGCPDTSFPAKLNTPLTINRPSLATFKSSSTVAFDADTQFDRVRRLIPVRRLIASQVSATIGSIFRSVLLTTRTVVVWVVNLLLFYTGLGGGVVGESWQRCALVRLCLSRYPGLPAAPPPEIG
jgi:hypothetical protein